MDFDFDPSMEMYLTRQKFRQTKCSGQNPFSICCGKDISYIGIYANIFTFSSLFIRTRTVLRFERFILRTKYMRDCLKTIAKANWQRTSCCTFLQFFQSKRQKHDPKSKIIEMDYQRTFRRKTKSSSHRNYAICHPFKFKNMSNSWLN